MHRRQKLGSAPHRRQKLGSAPHRRQKLGSAPHRRQKLGSAPHRRQKLGSAPHRRQKLGSAPHRRQKLGSAPHRRQKLGLERRRRRHPPRRGAAVQDLLQLAVEHLRHRQPVVDPGGDLGDGLQSALVWNRLPRRRGDNRGVDHFASLLNQAAALDRANLRPEVVPRGLALPAQLDAVAAADLGQDRPVLRDQIRTAFLAGVVLLAVPLRRERQPLHMPPRIEVVRVVVLAPPVRLVQRPLHDRVVQLGEPIGVRLGHYLGQAGFDQLDRDPHHVVPALPAVLALVDRLDAVRPGDGVAPARVGPGRGRIAGGGYAGPPGVVEEPRPAVLAGDGAGRGQGHAVAHRAGGRMALAAGLHHRAHEGVCHLVRACRAT